MKKKYSDELKAALKRYSFGFVLGLPIMFLFWFFIGCIILVAVGILDVVEEGWQQILCLEFWKSSVLGALGIGCYGCILPIIGMCLYSVFGIAEILVRAFRDK